MLSTQNEILVQNLVFLKQIVPSDPKIFMYCVLINLKLTGDEDETKVYYIGLRGEFFEAARTGVVNAVYESRPMLEDHKQDVDGFGMKSDNAGY